jgi:OOP family OmpA-OmpF porin
MRYKIAAGVLAVLAVVAGCSSQTHAKALGKHPSNGQRPPAGRADMVKEGWFGVGGGFHARLEIRDIERYPDKAVLRYFVTSLENEPKIPTFGVSGAAGLSNLQFKLVNPIGRKLYYPMYDANQTTVGSEAALSVPGVRYEAVLYFSPVPDVANITVISPGTAGEFAGVPVVAGIGPGTPTAPLPSSDETPAAGDTRAWPMLKVAGQPKGEVDDLYDVVETDNQTTTSSRNEETIELRTDVLFAFDSADLSPTALSTLDSVVQEIRDKADPAKPPVVIEGHTDGKGTREYNLGLSQRRAEAVHRQVQTRLGSNYQYRVEGKGETEPIAKEGGADDEQARQRNRRVEISYQIKQQPAAAAPGPTRRSGASRPATFHATDGATVASRTAQFNNGDTTRRIDVKPFYRDGPYLVAVFEITNLGPNSVSWIFGYKGETSTGTFGAFGVIDPRTRFVYRGVRIGPDDPTDFDEAFVDAGAANFREAPNSTNRDFFYAPAPPPDVTTVTLDAGPFGQIPNIPIQ